MLLCQEWWEVTQSFFYHTWFLFHFVYFDYKVFSKQTTVQCTILRSRNAQRGFIIKNALTFFPKQKNLLFYIIIRAGNSLIGFLSESLIFGGNLNDLLMVAHFWWATWAIRSHCSFLVSDLSDSLTLLIKKREWANHSFFK